jgi:trehalose 6-phosphate synthase/phosphatase
MARLLIVSNRLPVTIRLHDGTVAVEPSTGGLATGMKGPHARMGGVWIGWPGTDQIPADALPEVERRLGELRLVPVYLSADEVARYYEGYSNSVLWPVFHYAVARLPLDVADFDVYDAVNTRFAEAIAARYEPGDLVWIHDYQLMLVPRKLRALVPEAVIGFFLHIPFPSSEIFRLLPQRQALVTGLLGADVLGFHTAAFVRHFASSALRVLGAPLNVDRIPWQGREVRLQVFPMGIDAERFSRRAQSEKVLRLVDSYRAAGEKLLVGIDRLDYTKGIPRRLLAFESLLRSHPELREKVRLVQVAVPSRANIGAYRELREEVDAMVGRIHGEFATTRWSPVYYLYRGIAEDEVVALYRAADAVLVTPLRDGMNLVAKEFVASRPDEDGVLILSEFAGAAAELSEALLVNPYDAEQTGCAIHRALTMDPDERRTRMRVLRHRVLSYDVHWWARSFVRKLEGARQPSPDVSPLSSGEQVRAALERARSAERLALLLDYDGTLVPFAPTPDLAAPDAPLLALLKRLADAHATEVHLVSGRKRETLDRWFGGLPVSLHAEHGLWSRPPAGAWKAVEVPPSTWREPVLAILRDFCERTPGSLIEEKTAGLTWHYRSAEPEYGAAQANELKLHLSTLLSNEPVQILPGDMVVEVRPFGIHKGRIASTILSESAPGTTLLAVGDDCTDEDMFEALPPDGISVHVGPAPSRAALRIADVATTHAFLGAIAHGRRRAAVEPAQPSVP